MELNFIQKILKRIGLLIIKREVVMSPKCDNAKRVDTSFCFTNISDDITYTIEAIDFFNNEITMAFKGITKESVNVEFSDYKWERVSNRDNVYKFSFSK